MKIVISILLAIVLFVSCEKSNDILYEPIDDYENIDGNYVGEERFYDLMDYASRINFQTKVGEDIRIVKIDSNEDYEAMLKSKDIELSQNVDFENYSVIGVKSYLQYYRYAEVYATVEKEISTNNYKINMNCSGSGREANKLWRWGVVCWVKLPKLDSESKIIGSIKYSSQLQGDFQLQNIYGEYTGVLEKEYNRELIDVEFSAVDGSEEYPSVRIELSDANDVYHIYSSSVYCIGDKVHFPQMSVYELPLYHEGGDIYIVYEGRYTKNTGVLDIIFRDQGYSSSYKLKGVKKIEGVN